MSKLPRARIVIPLIILIKAWFKICFFKIKRSGPNKLLEEALASFWSLKYCITMPSCRIALYYILRSLKLKEGDEVLMTPITIPDIVNAVCMLGLKPVFVDMSFDDQNIDIKDMEKKISPKTKVLYLTYLSGIVPNVDLIMENAQKYNLIVIEDISQNYGSMFKGKLLGTFGIAAIGSFSMVKTLASLLGGVILTNEGEIFDNVSGLSDRELKKPSKGKLLQQILQQICMIFATNPFVFSYFTYYIFRVFAKQSPDLFFAPKKYSSKNIEKIPYYENYPVLRTRFPEEALVWFSDQQAEIVMETLKNLKEDIRLRRNLFNILRENLDSKVIELMPRSLMNVGQNVYWHIPILLEEKELRIFQKELLTKGFDIIGFNLRVCSMEPVFRQYYQETKNALSIKNQSAFLPIHRSFSPAEMKKLARAVNCYFANRRKNMGHAPFDNKVIVITGAASGLGRRLAVNLANRAKKLIVIDKLEKEASELCDELKQKNADIDKYIFDFNQIDKLEQEIDNVYRNYDHIDVVFNVAGMENVGYLDDLDIDVIQEVINVNLLAPFLFSKKVIPMMKKQRSGQIITIASDMGKRSIPGRSPYCISKFAVVALVEAMRLELQPYNIDAITVFPGLMQTPFWNKIKCFGRIDMEYLKNRSRMQDPDVVAKRIIKQIEHRKLILSKFSPMKIFLLLNYICPAFGDFIIRNCINLKKAKM